MTISAAPGINLDAIVGLEPEPPAPATTALVQKVTEVVQSSQSPATVMYRDQLDPALRAKILVSAKQTLPLIVANPNRLSDVGTPAVEGINAASDQLFHTFLSKDGVKIPELTEYTKELDRAVRGFSAKHNRPLGLGKYNEFKTWLTEWLDRNRDWLQELISDAKSLERRMDGVVAQIIDKQAQLIRNVNICNELYKTNESAILNLTVAVALMEDLDDELMSAISEIVIQPGEPDARKKSEERDNLATIKQQLEVRTSEFKQRLFVAIATSPQIRNIRTLNYGLSQRLGMIVNLTIPVFKLTVVQWAMTLQAQQGADMTKAATDFNNATLTAWAQSSSQMVPAMAQVIQTPSTSPETILVITNSLVEQFAGFDEAYQAGIQQRRAVDAAIVQSQAALAASVDKRVNFLNSAKPLVAAAQQPLVLPDAPQLPNEVLELVPQALANPGSLR